MCGCSAQAGAVKDVAVDPGAVRLSVPDMTCGHCVGTITKAIRAAFPGARVDADTATKLVVVSGGGDAAQLLAVVRDAGYTPAAA